MASGNTMVVLTPLHNEPPAASFATLDTRNSHAVLDYDATVDESAVFTGFMPRHYANGGITIKLVWAATSAVSGSTRWQTSLERVIGQDIDADGFATANSAGGTANATSGIPTETEIAHANGAEMDSVVAGDTFRLKVTRDADGTSGTDDMTGDAELIAVEIRET